MFSVLVKWRGKGVGRVVLILFVFFPEMQILNSIMLHQHNLSFVLIQKKEAKGGCVSKVIVLKVES